MFIRIPCNDYVVYCNNERVFYAFEADTDLGYFLAYDANLVTGHIPARGVRPGCSGLACIQIIHTAFEIRSLLTNEVVATYTPND
jgi:hypothetical protein